MDDEDNGDTEVIKIIEETILSGTNFREAARKFEVVWDTVKIKEDYIHSTQNRKDTISSEKST